jgi:hypothetical protein
MGWSPTVEVFRFRMYHCTVAELMPMNPRKPFSERPEVQKAAVRLFAGGKPRTLVIKLLAPHMYPEEWAENEPYALRMTRRKLRAWEESEWFRDAVYNASMVQLDADIPQIMRGMSRRARRRVDAARLVLEVTGRHNPRGQEQQPAVVQINFGGNLPRPSNRPQSLGPGDVEGEVVAEEDAE